MPIPNAQFAMTPGALAQLGKIRPDYMPDVWAWQNRATQADNTTLADMMRAAQEEEQLSPIRVKRSQADLESVMANTDRTRGLIDQDKEVTTQKRMANELEQHLLPQKKVTEFAELVTKADDEQRKQAELKVYEMLQSSDPKVRAIGQQLYPTLKSAIDKAYDVDVTTKGQLKVAGANNAAAAARQQELFRHQADLETQRTGRATAVAAINAEARKAAAAAGSDPKKWQELAVSLQLKLLATPIENTEAREELAKEIMIAQTMAERLAPQPAPVVDTNKVGGGKLKDARGPMPNPANNGKPDPLGIR